MRISVRIPFSAFNSLSYHFSVGSSRGCSQFSFFHCQGFSTISQPHLPFNIGLSLQSCSNGSIYPLSTQLIFRGLHIAGHSEVCGGNPDYLFLAQAPFRLIFVPTDRLLLPPLRFFLLKICISSEEVQLSSKIGHKQRNATLFTADTSFKLLSLLLQMIQSDGLQTPSPFHRICSSLTIWFIVISTKSDTVHKCVTHHPSPYGALLILRNIVQLSSLGLTKYRSAAFCLSFATLDVWMAVGSEKQGNSKSA